MTVEDTGKPKTPEQLVSDKLRMAGLTNSDPKTAEKLDAELSSRVVPGLRFKGDGTPYENSNTASAGQLRALGEFALQKTKDLAEDLLAGRIPVLPYQYRKKNGCEYCSFKGICGFDRLIPGYQYKTLEPKSLEQIAPEGGAGSPDAQEKGGAE